MSGTRPAPRGLAVAVPPWPGEEIRAGGQWLFVRRSGSPDGEPALFVHGLGGASTNWTDLMAGLGPRIDGRALDLPGFGYSPPPPDGRYRLDGHVAAVTRFLKEWDAGPVHLFGNSLGGAVSVRLAAERPDLVRTLTLVSPALPDLRPRRGLDPRMPLMLLPGTSGLLERLLARHSPEQRVAATLSLIYADTTRVHPQRRAEAVAELTRRNGLDYGQDAFSGSLRGLVGAWLERGPSNLWRQLAAISAPTLLVWGRRDRLVDVALAPRAHARLRDSRLVIFDDVGHVAQLEAPDRTTDAVLGFLDAVAATGSAREAPGVG